MTRWRRGLVIGKFRPPHKGHSFLIRTALERVDHLTLVVCSDAADTIPAQPRAAWLRELFPTVDIRVWETTGTDPRDSRFWAALTVRRLGAVPEVVFTSEAYGDAYARFLGCAHVCVDPARATVPIAASTILAHPLAYLDYLEPPVRAAFVLRVALVGAESTGKTSLARALADHYRTAWVPEYGRTYTDGLAAAGPVAWTTADFVYIAEAQQRLEDMLARHARRVLICDTDALTTSLWHERYLGHQAPAVRSLADTRRYALHILTGDEVAWDDDGTRERPHERPWFQRRFADELAASGRHYLLVTGPLAARLAAATAAIDRLLE